SIAASTREADPIGVRRRMRGVRARLPQRAGMRDHVDFVVDATAYIVFDGWKLAGPSWRPLRSRLTGNPFEIVELALQPIDPRQQLVRKLRPALDLMSKLSKARFEAVGVFEFINALCQLAKTRIQVGNPCEIIDLAL